MAFDQKEIFYASILGSKVAEAIPRFATLQNEIAKRVLPAVNLLPTQSFEPAPPPISNVTVNGSIWRADDRVSEQTQYFPLTFVAPDGYQFLLPYEPLINISGRNIIVRRNVAKMKPVYGSELGGTIKERWTQGDYEITITGFLMESIMTGDVASCFPRDDFQFLNEIITAAQSIKVYCEPLQLLGINQLVIEEFNFPFTKGENVQAYEIKAYSDFDYKLLLDIND